MKKSKTDRLLECAGVKYWTNVQNHRNKGRKRPLRVCVVHPPTQTRTAVAMGQL